MGRRLAVSDIHGEGHRLLKVLEKAKYDPGADRLFLLGDFIDRGNDSKRTLEIIMALNAVCLLGNHERMASDAGARYDCYEHWVSQGGAQTLKDFGGVLPGSAREWMRNLPYYHEEPDCILVHAGLRPNVRLIDQDPNDLLWIRQTFHQNYRGKLVIFGHTPTFILHGDSRNHGIWYGPDKIGIDTGAAYGGRLTLLDIDSHETWWA